MSQAIQSGHLSGDGIFTNKCAAWLEARARAASLGSARSEYYPSLDLSASVSRTDATAVGGRFSYVNTSYGPALALSYLLFDFGGRGARVGF